MTVGSVARRAFDADTAPGGRHKDREHWADDLTCLGGFGEELYARGLTQARKLGANVIETVVLASNLDGLRFAKQHGFVEVDRYLLPGDSVPFIDLRLP